MLKSSGISLLVLLQILGFGINHSQSYVWEAKRIIKPVYFQRNPTVLYAQAGFGSDSASPRRQTKHFSVFNSDQSDMSPIPTGFIRGASLRTLNPMFTDRILSKPKRWALSTPYDPRQREQQHPVDTVEPISNEFNSQLPPLSPVLVGKSALVTPFLTPERNYEENTRREDTPSWVEEPIVKHAIQPVHSDPSVYIEPEFEKAYLPAVEEPSWLQNMNGMESYRRYEDQEPKAPINPIRRSPSPWAQRNVERTGEPRNQACTMSLDRGLGPDEISSWYYDSGENRCRWFDYRGYGGNSNRFYSRTACEAYCIRDMENLCEVVTCSWPGTTCRLMADEQCKKTEERHGRDWRLRCTPDHPVCLSRRNTRMAPDVSFQPIPRECYQPKDSGSCQRKNPSVNYYYDRERNACMTFYYHNCEGNDNRFETKSDCMSHCSP